MRKAPKSPALCESGIVADGEVPSWPMNGRRRVASATRSCGAKPRIGFCAEPSGSAAKRAASPAKRSASSRPTVTPRRSRLVEGDRVAVGEGERRRVGAAVGAAHALGPDPLDARLAATRSPQPGHTGAQYGSPLKRPSIGRSLPELVAIEVTSMSRMRIAMASPTSAPATATGVDTSWPPRIDGVIIGPQQPGRRVDDDVAAVGHRPGHRRRRAPAGRR